MITVTTSESAVQFEFENNQHYLQQGTMEVPFNSLILVEDESDMITFRKASTNDILFSAMYTEFSSLGDTKDDVVGALEGMIFAEGGGGGGVDPEDVVEIVESALTDYWTSAQTQSAISQASSGKQDTLVSGTNIKTINNESLLGSGNITISGGGSNIVELTQAQYDALVSGGTVDPDSLYIITDASEVNLSGYALSSAVTQEIAAAVSGKADSSAVTQSLSSKQDTLVSGTNIKTINNQSLLGSGDITIGGGSSALFLDPNSIMIMTDEIWNNISDALFNDTPIFYIEKQDGQYSIMKPMEGQIDVSGSELYLTYFSYNNNNQVTITKIGSENYQTDFSRLNIQEALTAGSGITINGNVISANGGSVTIDPTLSSGSSNAVANSAITNAINAKQDTLLSGTNIKTINNQSLLGSGDITIGGGSSYQYYSEDTENKTANIHIENTDNATSADLGVGDQSVMMFVSTSEQDVGADSTMVRNEGISVIDGEATMFYGQIVDDVPTTNSYVSVGRTVGLGVLNEVDPMPYSHLNVGQNNISLEVQSDEDHTTTFAVSNSAVTINGERVLVESDGAYYISFATLATGGITDEDWDGIVAAIDSHRPIYAGYPRTDGGILYYGVECMNKNVSNTQIILTSSDNNAHYFYTFVKNGSNDYSYSVATKPYVPDITTAITSASTDTQLATAKAVYDQIGGLKFVSLTQSEYDQLATKDSTTIYFIKDNSN